MIPFSLIAFALYLSAVAPLAPLVLAPLRHLDLGRHTHALRAPLATPLRLNSAARRALELRVRRRLYPGHRGSIRDAAS